jgi:RHS repeat-associated protein
MVLAQQKTAIATSTAPCSWRTLLLNEVLPEVDSFGGRYLAGSSIFENGKATVGGGLYYYNARYYDPDLGRFIQPDSKLDGLNRYAYCHNNPVRYTDPTGENSWDFYNALSNNSGDVQNALSPLQQTIASTTSTVTVQTAPQNPANTTTLTRPNGQTTTINSITENNPILQDLVKQNSPSLNDIPNMTDSGCKFSVDRGFPELAVGQALTPDQIKKLYNESKNNNAVNDKQFVDNPDTIANLALKELGRPDLKMTFGWKANDRSVEIGHELRGTTESGKTHYLIGSTTDVIIWDSYTPDRTMSNLMGVSVYAYANDQ